MDVVAVDDTDQVMLLDLLNTTPVVGGIACDDLADQKQARAWMRERGIPPIGAEQAALIAARTLLQQVVRGQEGPAALQRFLTAVSLQPGATKDGLDWRPLMPNGFTGAVRAVLAWDALRISHPGRLRPCANMECQLFLIDRSKPNTARWCSMAICGNRMKARRHYRRVQPSSE